MAMKPAMKFEEALGMAHAVAKGRSKYGSMYSPAYNQSQLLEAIQVLGQQCTAVAEAAAEAHKDEVTKLRRQYAALNARYVKATGKSVAEDDGV